MYNADQCTDLLVPALGMCLPCAIFSVAHIDLHGETLDEMHDVSPRPWARLSLKRKRSPPANNVPGLASEYLTLEISTRSGVSW
jgi:hypothetical protein